MYLENIDFKFCVPTELSSLVIIRNNIEESISPLSISEDTIFDIELSENEIVNDVFIHDYKGASGLIKIYLNRDADSEIITFSGKGQLFDPTSIPLPEISLPLEIHSNGDLGNSWQGN